MRTHIYEETINVFFKHLDWGIQPFQLYSGKIPSLIEWLLNPRNKGKKCLCLPYVAVFFRIILSGAFLIPGVTPTRQRGVKIK